MFSAPVPVEKRPVSALIEAPSGPSKKAKLSQIEPKPGDDQANKYALEAMKSDLFKAASAEVKAMVQSTVHEIKRELKAQYGAKLRVQQDTIKSFLKQLLTLTADMESQRELDLRRELVTLKQKESMQSDQYHVYDIHLSHA